MAKAHQSGLDMTSSDAKARSASAQLEIGSSGGGAGLTRTPLAGFTIIEVLIVLAIAALIMLVVFLAVPALQRNSRNTQYRNEASRILAGAQEFTINNGNTLPVAANEAAIRANANTKSITSLVIVNPGTATAVTPTLTAATLETGVTCGASGGASVTPVAGSAPAGSMILIYGVEKNDGTVIAQCVNS